MTLRLCADLLISADKISKISPHRQEHITQKIQEKKITSRDLNQPIRWLKLKRMSQKKISKCNYLSQCKKIQRKFNKR